MDAHPADHDRDHDGDDFERQPHFSERLRLHFEPLVAAPDEARRASLESEARQILMRLLALEDSVPGRNNEEEKESNADLLRLERKLDLVLELLAVRMLDADAATEETPVRISASAICWETSTCALSEGMHGVMSVHLHRLLPRPLRLPVRLRRVTATHATAEFLPLEEECEELLVRYVFLHHRRDLAGHKRLPVR